MSGQLQLKVAAVPNDTYGETNCVFVNAADATPSLKHALINDFIFSVRVDDAGAVQRGTLAMNLLQRRSARVSNSPGDVLDLDPGFAPPTAVAMAIRFEVEYFSASKTGGSLDFVHVVDTIRGKFGEQYFLPQQQILFILDGVKFQLTVLEVAASGAKGAASAIGQLLPETSINLLMKEKCNIQLTNVPDVYVDQAQTRVVNAFDLQKLGIGGLRAQFGEVFRRAFASRIFPQSVVRKLGMKHVKGILLYGPPGTGKTLIARKIGEILNCKPPKIVNGPEIFNKFVGVAEENIRKLFADAEADAPKGDQSPLHLIIFDEFDSICKQRGAVRDGTGVGDNVVNQLLSKIDGVNQLNNVLLIGMTNRKDLIDEAILRPGRFEVHVEIGLPDEHGRVEILQIHTRSMKEHELLHPDVDLAVLAERTKNFSGAELEGLVRSAQSFAFSRHLDFDNPTATIDAAAIKITMADFVHGLDEVKPAFGASKDDCNMVIRNGIIDLGPSWKSLVSRANTYIQRLRESTRLSNLAMLIHGDVGTGKSSLATHLALTSGFPYVKFLSTDTLVGYGEMQKTNIFRKAFDDAYKSNLSVIILDDLERLVEYSSLGARYSNVLLQSLLVLIKRPPPEGKKLLVIATCTSLETTDLLECHRCFNVDIEMPALPGSALAALSTGVGATWRSKSDLDSAQALLGEATMPMKKFLLLIELSLGESESTSGRRELTYDGFQDAYQRSILGEN